MHKQRRTKVTPLEVIGWTFVAGFWAYVLITGYEVWKRNRNKDDDENDQI